MPTEAFVPLISISPAPHGESANFQAKVISQPEQVQKFKAAESTATTSSATTASRGAHCEPRVTVQRDGEHVTGIRVQCSCGEVIDLACVYPADAAKA